MTTIGRGAAYTAANQAAGTLTDPYLSFNFHVEVEGLVVGGFSGLHGLDVETEIHEYQEGGRNGSVHRLPGPVRYSNLVLERGLMAVQGLWDWCEEIMAGRIVRRDLSIFLLDHRHLPAMWWDVYGAYPAKWQGPRLDAKTNGIAIETVELAHEGFVQPAASRAASVAPCRGPSCAPLGARSLMSSRAIGPESAPEAGSESGRGDLGQDLLRRYVEAPGIVRRMEGGPSLISRSLGKRFRPGGRAETATWEILRKMVLAPHPS